jgi:hypothetical protein
MTYPLIFHLFDGLAGGFGTGDSLGNVSLINWVKRAIFDLHVDFRYFNYMLYPYGVDILKETNFSIDYLLAVPLTVLGGPVFAYNLFFLLELSLSAFAMYLFIKYLTGDMLIATYSGFVFGFCTYHFARGFAGHFNMFGTWWIPLMLLYLHRAIAEKKARYSAVSALFFVLATLTSGYYGVMCGAVILCIVLFYAAQAFRRVSASDLSKFIYGLNIHQFDFAIKLIICFVAFSLPLTIYLDYVGAPGNPYSIEYLAIYSASPEDYLTPASIHPIWQILGERPLTHGLPWERDVYLGMSVVILAYLGVARSRDRMRWLYLFVAAVSFLLSLGPYLWVGETLTSLPLPYKFLAEYVPLLARVRALNRFGLIVMLAVSSLAGFGLASIVKGRSIISRCNRRIFSRRNALTMFLILVVAVEFASVPFPVLEVKSIEGTAAYHWLATQSGDFAIVEYPIGSLQAGGGGEQARAMWGTVIHGKHTVSGGIVLPKSKEIELVDRLRFFEPNFGNVDLNLYRSLNIRYVLFHEGSYVGMFGLDNWYRAVDLANRTEGLTFVDDMEGTLVYRVM